MHALRLFTDVAICRSFSQAAAKHGITQSAASQRIGTLEKRLGVTLIDRSVRPLALTSAGQAYLEGCRALIEEYTRLERKVSRLAAEPAGDVVVDAIYSAGIDLLNQIKDRFEAVRPRVRVVVDYKRPEQVYAAVRDRACDLGILSYPQRWPGVGVIPLRNERMAVVCAPGHPLARRRRLHAAELAGYPMAGFEPTLPAAKRIRRYLRQHGVRPDMQSLFDNVDTVKAAVAVTDQLAILPRRTVMRELCAGTLAVVELTPELLRPLGVIYPRASQRGQGSDAAPSRASFTPAAQAFIDFLLQHAGPNVDLAEEAATTAGHLVGGSAL